MNEGIRKFIILIVKKSGLFFYCNHIISSLRLPILKRIFVGIRLEDYQIFKRSKNYSVLANGSSLRAAFENGEVLTRGSYTDIPSYKERRIAA